MKKVILSILAAFAVTAIATSCTTISPGYGFGSQAVVPGVAMKKTGEASGKFLFGMLPLPSADTSIATAAKNGGITKIATIDTKVYRLGPLVTKTTIVTGE
ncbi:MAG: TRL-like family protein [Treponema sp.]|nr:TRL-like family protein [Treponema sp.]